MKLFEILPTGDPYNRTGWDVREYTSSYAEQFPVFRGDLSPYRGRDNTVAMLKRRYPGCKVKVNRTGANE